MSETARKIVGEIMDELTNYRALRHVFDNLEPWTMQGINEECEHIVDKHLAAPRGREER